MYMNANKNIVKMYYQVGAVDWTEMNNKGWYYCDGSTVNTVLFGSVTLPDMRDYLVKGSTSGYTGNVVEQKTDLNQWEINAPSNNDHLYHKHYFDFNAAETAEHTGHNHNHSLNDNNQSVKYTSIDTRSSNNDQGNNPNHSDREWENLHYGDNWTDNSVRNRTDANHVHSITTSFGNWAASNNLNNHLDSEHDHELNMFTQNTVTRPKIRWLHHIMYLGPKA